MPPDSPAPIRVGLIRCDTHGGAYFNTHCADATRMTGDAVDGVRLIKVWDEHADAAAGPHRAAGRTGGWTH